MEDPQQSLGDTIYNRFAFIDDSRAANAAHPLITVLFCVIVAILCGADGFVQAEEYARLRKSFIRKWVPLHKGRIPGHDTMTRVLGSIDPDQFVSAFAGFMEALTGRPRQDIINVDGKTLRGVVGAGGRKGASHVEDQAHIVFAFSTFRLLVLGQLRSKNVANEVRAAQELLQMIDIDGSVVTMDAAHTIPATLQIVNERGADFVVAVKNNAPTLNRQIATAFRGKGSPKVVVTQERTHGKVERRKYEILPATPAITSSAFGMVRSVMRVSRKNVSHSGKQQRTTAEIHYASSLPVEKAELFAKCVRNRWFIENKANYVLDVCFDEDRSRIRVKNAPENFSRCRHIGFSLLASMKTVRKLSMALKRANASGDDRFLARALRLPRT